MAVIKLIVVFLSIFSYSNVFCRSFTEQNLSNALQSVSFSKIF